MPTPTPTPTPTPPNPAPSKRQPPPPTRQQLGEASLSWLRSHFGPDFRLPPGAQVVVTLRPDGRDDIILRFPDDGGEANDGDATGDTGAESPPRERPAKPARSPAPLMTRLHELAQEWATTNLGADALAAQATLTTTTGFRMTFTFIPSFSPLH